MPKTPRKKKEGIQKAPDDVESDANTANTHTEVITLVKQIQHPQQKTAQITHIDVLHSASSSFAEVDHPDSQKLGHHAISIVGVAKVEFVNSDDDYWRPIGREYLDLMAWMATESGGELGDVLGLLPPLAASLLSEVMCRTQRLRQEAGRWNQVVAPLQGALSDALVKAIPPEEPPLPLCLLTGPAGLDGWGSGAGHPVLRSLQQLVHKQQPPGMEAMAVLVRAAMLVGQECFSQFRLSDGIVVLGAAIRLTLMVAGTIFTSPPRRTPESDGAGGPTIPTDAFGKREMWLQALHPALLTMHSNFCVTRAESPDIRLQFVEFGIADPHAALSLGSPQRAKAPQTPRSGRSGRPAKKTASHLSLPVTSSLRPGQESLQGHPLSFSAATEVTIPAEPSSQGDTDIVPEKSNLTPAGNRRMQLWDGFFAYRALGSVSWELAADQLQRVEKDSDEDESETKRAAFMYNLSPTRWRPGVSSQLPGGPPSKSSPFVALSLVMDELQSTSPRSPGSPQSPRSQGSPQCKSSRPFRCGRKLDAGIFPALGQRRKSPHLSALRRPAGNRMIDDAISHPMDTTALPGQAPGHGDLPAIVSGAKNALTRGSSVSNKQDLEGADAQEALARDPLRLPMFMDVVPEKKVKMQDEQTLAFVNGGVGFEIQPLAAVKARRASELAKQQAEKERKNQRTARLSASSPYGSEHDDDDSPDKLVRCRYCAHHDIAPCSSAQVEASKKKSGRAAPGAAFNQFWRCALRHPGSVCFLCWGRRRAFQPQAPTAPGRSLPWVTALVSVTQLTQSTQCEGACKCVGQRNRTCGTACGRKRCRLIR